MTPSRALCLVCVLHASTARAELPVIDLVRCETFGDELRAAISAEIEAIAVERDVTIGDRTIVISCPDAVSAHIEIQPPPASGPLTRRLHLGDIPDALRVRLIALATAELADVASRLHVAPTTTTSSTSMTASAPSVPLVTRVERSAAPPLPNLADGSPPDSLALMPRAGMRTFAAQAPWLVELGAEASLGPYGLGIVAATGAAGDPLGRVRGYLVALAATARVACTGERFAVCVGARAEVGLAVAIAEGRAADVMAADARAPYVAGAGDVVASYSLGAWTLTAGATLGWAEGLIARASDRIPLRLDGMMIGGAVGLRWQR
jgi:hypothetical protein